ncbi:MAG TPA: PglZ domain-containing protein [Bryobacteraceae bacterium]|nr:PglZ domain-containing protein [Bryobacteraceae bacterium]
MASEVTLRSWLRSEIAGVLSRKVTPPPLVIWCDPQRAWRELLRAAAEGGAFELWCDEAHELVLRERLLAAPSAPRVVWLPVARDGITFLKVFELQAEMVWTEPLISALARFGVELPRDQEAELRDLLPAHAVEWVDRPRSAWRELTPGAAKSTLVDDDQVLSALARTGVPLAGVVGAERLSILVRRATDDFGLPAPVAGNEDDWRIEATARLLVTEATVKVPADPPREAARLIPPGLARENALKLLERWQRHIDLMESFEVQIPKADAVTTLSYWARNLAHSAPPLASRAAEEALFQREVDQLASLEEFEELAKRLEESETFYAAHARGFWGSRAESRVPWQSLVTLARAAALLRQQFGVEKQWRHPRDAVGWFTTNGWEVDRHGEALFRHDPKLPGGLHGVRVRLRRAYLRHLDRSNAAFSDLLHHEGVDALGLPFAGEILAGLHPAKEPLAVLVLDACRYDLGARLAEALNKGEPVPRARVEAARAPLPSITALGMPFALAEEASGLVVELTAGPQAQWRVTAQDGAHDLAAADGRKEWLRRRFKLKAQSITNVKSVLESPPAPKEAGRLLFVFGDEFDVLGHEGELQFTGAEEYLERYVRAIRRLREAGYPNVVVVTDHGFLHWEPDADEVEEPPSGEIVWRSRRAVVGRGLKHPTAIAAAVPGSDLECRVPRSVNAFRTYGRLGYFHGGATLQELVIPVVIFRWPRKAEKVAAVLTPVAEITSLKPRVEVRPGSSGRLPGFGAEVGVTGREVTVKVVEPATGRRLFKAAASVRIEPDGEPISLVLEREAGESCARGSRLQLELRDADNDELLDRCEVELKVDLEEWD